MAQYKEQDEDVSILRTVPTGCYWTSSNTVRLRRTKVDEKAADTEERSISGIENKNPCFGQRSK